MSQIRFNRQRRLAGADQADLEPTLFQALRAAGLDPTPKDHPSNRYVVGCASVALVWWGDGSCLEIAAIATQKRVVRRVQLQKERDGCFSFDTDLLVSKVREMDVLGAASQEQRRKTNNERVRLEADLDAQLKASKAEESQLEAFLRLPKGSLRATKAGQDRWTYDLNIKGLSKMALVSLAEFVQKMKKGES